MFVHVRWLAVCSGLLSGWVIAEPGLPARAVQQPGMPLAWSPAPAGMPAGAQMQLLEGDPAAEGLFTLRLKLPAGVFLPPHWHPRDERVTVLSGRVGVGFGETFDARRLSYIEAGGFYLNPTPVAHFVHFPVDTVVQITGQGPWQTYRLQADDTRPCCGR